MTNRGYDFDLVLWAEDQADLLRRRAAGELVNDAELDWLNIAEEIEDLGRSQRRELGSRIAEILDHLIRREVSSADGPRGGVGVRVCASSGTRLSVFWATRRACGGRFRR